MVRVVDFVLSLVGLVVLTPLMLLLCIVGYLDTGSPLFFQKRVGRHKKAFTLVKFRTMKLSVESVASHMANASDITRFGRFLRRTKLDELPQLWNVLKGEMSLVGPRPCLFSQQELIAEREARGVYEMRPGVTGFAQINGIDMSTPRLLAENDAAMLPNLSLWQYFVYIFRTVAGKGAGDGIKQ